MCCIDDGRHSVRSAMQLLCVIVCWCFNFVFNCRQAFSAIYNMFCCSAVSHCVPAPYEVWWPCATKIMCCFFCVDIVESDECRNGRLSELFVALKCAANVSTCLQIACEWMNMLICEYVVLLVCLLWKLLCSFPLTVDILCVWDQFCGFGCSEFGC